MKKTFQYLSCDGKTIGDVQTKLNLNPQVQAPVKAGDTAGTLEYYENGRKLGEINILFYRNHRKSHLQKLPGKNNCRSILTKQSLSVYNKFCMKIFAAILQNRHVAYRRHHHI